MRTLDAGCCSCLSSPRRGRGTASRLVKATKKRLHHNVLAIALANKLARIALLARGRNFEATTPGGVIVTARRYRTHFGRLQVNYPKRPTPREFPC